MQYITKLKLAVVHQLCDVEDKSTEYMLQLMQDTTKLSLDVVLAYMALDTKEHSKLFKDLNSLVEIMVQLDK